jgi:hypothetical protein
VFVGSAEALKHGIMAAMETVTPEFQEISHTKIHLPTK